MTDTGVQITAYAVLPHRLIDDVWEMYNQAFTPMKTLAAQRHVFWWEEYLDMVMDPKMTKLVAHNGSVINGLACYTNHLSAVHLIEPAFFEAREPKLAELGHIWYTAFVCVAQRKHPKPPARTFRELIVNVAEPVYAARGVCYMDYASVRVNGGLPTKANDILKQAYGEQAIFETVDAQTYCGYFPAGRPL